MKRYMTKKEMHNTAVYGIVKDQALLKNTYGDKVQILFDSGPMQDVINMGLDRYKELYTVSDKKTEFELQTGRSDHYLKPNAQTSCNENRFE